MYFYLTSAEIYFKMKTLSCETFQYTVSNQGKYLEVTLIGVLTLPGIHEATESILAMSEQTGIKRVFYDASQMKQSDEARKASVEYFKTMNERMDKLATYLPNLTVFTLAVFLSVLARAGKWKPFRTKEKALAWLTE